LVTPCTDSYFPKKKIEGFADCGVYKMMKQASAELPADEELVRRIQEGDDSAFDTLVRHYLPKALRMAHRFCRNPEDAADAVQEAFLRAYTHIGKFDFRGQFATWFFRILTNLCLNQARALHRFKKIFLRPEHPLPETGWLENFAGESDPRREQEQAELQRAIDAGLKKLPPSQRLVLILYDLEGFSQREIAQMLEIPEGTVMSRLYYARRAMQPFLQEFRT
jgi:RNA polymerase sigma-70 factor (ECF subfamily)